MEQITTPTAEVQTAPQGPALPTEENKEQNQQVQENKPIGQKIGHGVYKSGEAAGQRQAEKKWRARLESLGLDPDNLENQFSELQGLIQEPEEKKANSKPDKVLEKLQAELLKTKSEVKLIREQAERDRRDLVVKNSLTGILTNGRQPHNLDETVEALSKAFDFEVGDSGLIVKDKTTGLPAMNDQGDFIGVGEAVERWVSGGNAWRFKQAQTPRPTGAGLSSSPSGPVSDIDWKRVQDGDVGYINSNLVKIKAALKT